jgi:hypothetical protein
MRLCSVCGKREAEVREPTKLLLRRNLCGVCYGRERYEYKKREDLAKAVPDLLDGASFRDVFKGKGPDDPAFWLKPAREASKESP